MPAPLLLALVVGAPVAWPAVVAIGDGEAEPRRAAAPRSATMTLECTAPPGGAGRPGAPVRLTCKVHGLELVLYAREGMPHFWETMDPFDGHHLPAPTIPPAPAGVARVQVQRRPNPDDLLEPFGPTTLLVGRQMQLEVELLDPYFDDRSSRTAPELMDPFVVSPPPVPDPLPLGRPDPGHDPDGLVPLPR
jgi:hypothetical protein